MGIVLRNQQDEAREQVLDELGSPLAARGFGPKDFAETYLIFDCEYVPASSWLLTIVLFPIGLLFFFLRRRTATLFFECDEHQEGTEVKIDGEARASVWKLLKRWRCSSVR